jgi:hypothetical protein
MFVLRVWYQRHPDVESAFDVLLFKGNIGTIVSCKRKINRYIKLHGNTVFAEVRRIVYRTKHKDFPVVANYHCIYGWKGLLHIDNYRLCSHR